MTLDTVVIGSGADTVPYNDLALRTSVATEDHTDPDVSLKIAENTFGVSLVYNF